MRMSDVSIDNLSVKERLKEALLRFDISQTKAAKEMGLHIECIKSIFK
ncbi:hypothetical protein [Treponema phagedenis]|nr:hypothetical protein [Treponema phagedenis]